MEVSDFTTSNAIFYYGFPIVIKNHFYILPRNKDYIIEKEVLPAVLNAKYIDPS